MMRLRFSSSWVWFELWDREGERGGDKKEVGKKRRKIEREKKFVPQKRNAEKESRLKHSFRSSRSERKNEPREGEWTRQRKWEAMISLPVPLYFPFFFRWKWWGERERNGIFTILLPDTTFILKLVITHKDPFFIQVPLPHSKKWNRKEKEERKERKGKNAKTYFHPILTWKNT